MKLSHVVWLLLAALPLAAAGPENRGPLNQHTPDWLTLHAEARFRAEDYRGVGFEPENERGFLLQRYRFSARFRVTPWMRAFGELQDAREAGALLPGPGLKDSLDLRQAWLGFGTEDGHWDLTAGRQMLAFGSERIVGAGEWGNTARVFDAVKLGLHRGEDRVDVFSASVVRNDVDEWDHHRDGDNLHGVYGSIRSAVPVVRLDPYVLWRTSPGFSSAGASGPYESWSYGFRAVDAALDNWDYEVEVTSQRGDIGPSRLASWAFTAIGRRIWNDARWRPTAVAEFSFASGDSNPSDGVVNTFDQLYPTNHGKYGVVDQVGRRNMKDAMGGVWLHPSDRLTLKTEAHSFRLANRNDALYTAGGAMSIPAAAGGAASTDIGREFDVMGDFRISKHYDVGMQIGHLFPGKFVRMYSPGAGRTFYTVYLDLRI